MPLLRQLKERENLLSSTKNRDFDRERNVDSKIVMKNSNAIHHFVFNNSTTRGAKRQVQMMAIASDQHIKIRKRSILLNKIKPHSSIPFGFLLVFTSNSLMNWRAYKQATELVEKLTNCHRIESTMESVILSKDLFDVIQFFFQSFMM